MGDIIIERIEDIRKEIKDNTSIDLIEYLIWGDDDLILFALGFLLANLDSAFEDFENIP